MRTRYRELTGFAKTNAYTIALSGCRDYRRDSKQGV